MKTYSARTQDNPRNWFIIDAQGLILGRLASEIAFRLRGKNIPEFTPHSDMGESIIVINADKIKVTGKKMTQKHYYSHSMYPGSLKSISLEKLMVKKPTEALRKAVFGMLPKNPMGREVMRKLKIYQGHDHPHAAQLPKQLILSN